MLPTWVPRLHQRRGVASFDGKIYVIFTISILRRAASRRHSIEGARSSKCSFKLLLASLDRFPSADGMYFHLFRRLLTAVALPLSSTLRPRFILAAAAPSSTFNPYRTQRLHGPHVREEAVFHKCALLPERALSGPSWAFAGSDGGSPPGDGMDTADRHLPAGAAQGGPRGGPESARLSYNGFILGSILVPPFQANLHTVLRKVAKWASQKLSKGRGIVAPNNPPTIPPNNPPKAYLK